MPTKRIRWSVLLVIMGIMLSATTILAQAAPSRQGTGDGEKLFKAKCAACHVIGKKALGPDLKGVTDRRDNAWLKAWIKSPKAVLAAGDPIATGLLKEFKLQMSELNLSDAEIDSVIAYLATTGTAPVATPAPALQGNADNGRALFTAKQRLTNGGPACIACHSVTGIGALGGGALGPDLTDAYTRLGGDALVDWLASPPPPTMGPLWSSTPMTDQERADLVAFLKEVSGIQERPASALGMLAILSGGGGILLIVIAHLLWQRRLAGVRGPMVANANAKKK